MFGACMKGRIFNTAFKKVCNYQVLGNQMVLPTEFHCSISDVLSPFRTVGTLPMVPIP